MKAVTSTNIKWVVKILNYKIYLKEFLILFSCFFLVEPIFSWIFIQNSYVTNTYVKLLSLVIYPIVLINFPKFKTFEKVFIVLFTLLIIKCIVESIYLYGTVFNYFEIYVVIFPVIFAIFIKSTLRKFNIDILEFIAKFHLCTYLVFMLLFGRSFSLGLSEIEMTDYGPFSGDTRIVHAQSIFMIVIPYLWYLNKYVFTRKLKFFWGFLFCFLIILLHQHRSVWSSTIVATAFYFMSILRWHCWH